MYTELCGKLTGRKLNMWKEFLLSANLLPDSNVSNTAITWENDQIIACGSMQDNLIKCIAVDPKHQGEGLTATIITTLKQVAFKKNQRHLFLYTKPENRDMFSSLFFYPVANTNSVLLMESKKNGITDFLGSLPKTDKIENIGSIVMNCNPFTLGHQYLIETAAKECSHLYIFVVSEDKSMFSFTDRIEMVKLGASHLPNVSVLPTGPYLVSAATFPDYFIKERDNLDKIHCLLDVEIFAKHFAPLFFIKKRFLGSEPLSKGTDSYNTELKENLPKYGIEVYEIPRLKTNDITISASTVRELISKKDYQTLSDFIPKTTFDYLKNNNLV